MENLKKIYEEVKQNMFCYVCEKPIQNGYLTTSCENGCIAIYHYPNSQIKDVLIFFSEVALYPFSDKPNIAMVIETLDGNILKKNIEISSFQDDTLEELVNYIQKIRVFT